MWTSLSDCGRVNTEGKNLLRWVTSVRSYSPGMIFKNAVIRTMCLITASLYSALLVINITCSFHLYPDKYNISTLKRLERQWLNRKRTNDLKKWIKLGYPQATTYSLTFRGSRDSGDFVIYEPIVYDSDSILNQGLWFHWVHLEGLQQRQEAKGKVYVRGVSLDHPSPLISLPYFIQLFSLYSLTELQLEFTL